MQNHLMKLYSNENAGTTVLCINMDDPQKKNAVERNNQIIEIYTEYNSIYIKFETRKTK